jgi:hypothetical protein
MMGKGEIGRRKIGEEGGWKMNSGDNGEGENRKGVVREV